MNEKINIINEKDKEINDLIINLEESDNALKVLKESYEDLRVINENYEEKNNSLCIELDELRSKLKINESKNFTNEVDLGSIKSKFIDLESK